jgi:plastocyanin
VRQRRRYVAAVAAAAVGLVVTGCGSSSSSTATTTAATTAATTPVTTAVTTATGAASVTIQQIAFHPSTLNVKTGDTVTWHFNDNGVLHTVTADDGSFDSGQHGSGEFTHTFDHAGTFKYHCSIHATMTGSIVVS